MVTLAETLLGQGLELNIVDPYLEPAEIVGANLTASAVVPHLNRLISRDAKEAIREQLVVAALKCVDEAALNEALTSEHIVVNVNGWPALQDTDAEYVGFCW